MAHLGLSDCVERVQKGLTIGAYRRSSEGGNPGFSSSYWRRLQRPPYRVPVPVGAAFGCANQAIGHRCHSLACASASFAPRVNAAMDPRLRGGDGSKD
jgi:hypothetical protein